MAGRDRRAKGVPEGKPFVRPTERPDVGGQAFGDMAKAVSLLGDRLAKLEKKLG